MTRAGKKLRIVFMGTPGFAVPALHHLIDSRHEVIAVYTQPPRPRGRGQTVQLSEVHEAADRAGLPVYTPRNFKSRQAVKDFKSLNADLAVVTAYGLILPKEVLETPGYGCINIHASLLPRWRGAAPIQRAILAGDSRSGISIMQMDEGLDTGPVITTRSVVLHPCTTARSLHDELAALGAATLIEVVDELAEKGMLHPQVQSEEGTCYASMLRKEEGRIDWMCPADVIDRQIRAFNPWPGTWCLAQGGKRLKILEAAPADTSPKDAVPGTVPGAVPGEDAAPGTIITKDGLIRCGSKSRLKLLRVQPENARQMDVAAALNGGYFQVGMQLQ